MRERERGGGGVDSRKEVLWPYPPFVVYLSQHFTSHLKQTADLYTPHMAHTQIHTQHFAHIS